MVLDRAVTASGHRKSESLCGLRKLFGSRPSDSGRGFAALGPSCSPSKKCCITLQFPSPSFPLLFSGNPGEFRTGPPIKRFGGDELGFRVQISSSAGVRKLMHHFVVSEDGMCKISQQ